MAKHQNNLRRALISFDWAIKRVLRNKTNFGVLEGFLSELLQQPIVVEDLMESSTNKAHAKDKFMVVDIVCKATSGELYLIELQFGAELDYFQRMLFGTSKMIADHLEEGEQYLKIPKLHSIHIVYFDLGTGEDCIYHGRTEFTGIKKSDKLQ
jgi:predicted transposase/invertase (TIGR01784 family)